VKILELVLRHRLSWLAIGAAWFVACSGAVWRPASEANPASSSRLQRILERGELRVGTSADLPPLTLRDAEGSMTGFEVDLVRSLAAAMGLEPRFVVKPFGELLGTLEADEVDLVVAGMTMTPDRNARFAFAGPTFISGTSLVSLHPELTEPAELADLDRPERRYAALAGSTSADFVRRQLPRASLVETADYAEGVAMLLAGDADAMVADFLACKLASWEHAEAGLRALHTPLTTEPLGIALPPDDPLLLNLVQNYLNTLERTGELTLLKARWLSRGGWLHEQP
jgi:polar amino acid transport system substrate-binding protein